MKYALFVSLLPLALGCQPIEPSGTVGELHQGGFDYCESPDICDGAPIPDRIAVASTFLLSFSEDATVSSDSPKLLAGPSGGDPTFHALGAGHVKVSARDPDGALVDYVTVDLSDIAGVDLVQCARAFNAVRTAGDVFFPSDCDGGTTKVLTISRGDSLAPTVCVRMLDEDDDVLGGAPDADWTVSTDASAALQLEVARDPRCATVGGLTLGRARVTVAIGEANAGLDVQVEP
ncbi:MAG TPA: hypothetical protein VHU80_10135 [Polyangiaceae bacterium]|jgi:hypothetical protein|nr:hypothetical protein [Polyangiaceae bacterium]